MKKEARALVLGSGGVTGVGWELGLLAGLREAGLDLTQADVLVGTSAGSIVAALLATGVHLATDAARAVALAPLPRSMGPSPSVDEQAEELRRAGVRVAVARPDAAARRVIGRNNLDPSRRAGAARAGRTQAASEIAALREVWLG